VKQNTTIQRLTKNEKTQAVFSNLYIVLKVRFFLKEEAFCCYTARRPGDFQGGIKSFFSTFVSELQEVGGALRARTRRIDGGSPYHK